MPAKSKKVDKPKSAQVVKVPDLPDTYRAFGPEGGGAEEFEFLPETRERWEQVWSSSHAGEYRPDDMPGLVSWARLLDQFNRGALKYANELRHYQKLYGIGWGERRHHGIASDIPEPDRPDLRAVTNIEDSKKRAADRAKDRKAKAKR